MKCTLARVRGITLRHWRSDLLPWAIALSVAIDYFDNTIFSFFTSYIAGGINASPDELVWSSTAYATTSVLGIVQQQWLIERLGFRRYLSGCLLMFALGSLAASLSESSLELAMARGFQGYFIGPMLGTCRILLQTGFTPQQRAPATRLFLTLILLASALAPLAGGYLVGYFDWRALFTCSTVGGVVLAAFAFLVVPQIGRRRRAEQRSATHLWSYLLFAVALGGLQIVAQQVRFELFSTTPMLPLLTVAGLAAIGWFGWHQWHDPHPLVRLNALREGPYRLGIVLYAFYYFISNAMGYLVSRLLQSGLGYPVENAGRIVGFTSLAAIPVAFAYFRYSQRIRRKWLIVPGFAMAACVGLWVLNLPPDVSTGWLLPPLVLRGCLLMFIALPTAGAAFQIFSNDEFTHGYRFKNIVKQLAYSLSTATVIILEQHRTAVHQTRLVEFASPYNPVFQNTLDTMTHAFEAQGLGAGEARGLSLGQLATMVAHQASFLSVLDGFEMIVVLALLGGAVALMQRQIR
jgi:MFS transporter, DHA2 family, multidrug resistance protein